MNDFREKFFKGVTYVAALFSIVFLFAIILSIFFEGVPLFKTYNFFTFLGGLAWHPTSEPADYGILTLIVGSFVTTIGALIIAIPLGLGSAIFIAEIAPPKLKEVLKPVIELLAGIPSVIYGLFGMAFLAPFITKLFHIDTGLNIFSASIILGIMCVPIISSMSEDAITNVSISLREASFALGANKWETIVKVIVPAAKSGIIGSIILGFGRAIGETMVVLMVAGGAPMIPQSIFSPTRTMTATIAGEMGECVLGSNHYYSLYAIGIVLFVITFATNLLTEVFILKKRGDR